jgi:hypothetical protein
MVGGVNDTADRWRAVSMTLLNSGGQQPPSNFSVFLYIKNERAYLVGGGPGKLKNIFLNSRSKIHALAELFSSRVRLGFTK